MTSNPSTSTSAMAVAVPPSRPPGGSVLAVVIDDPSAEAVLARAAAAATVRGAPLTVALLHPRDGFSTDPALLAWTRRQRLRRLQSLLTDSEHVTGTVSDGVLLGHGWRPRRSRDRLVAGLVANAAQRCEASLVVAPLALEPAVSQLRVQAIVVPPSTKVAPFPARVAEGV